MIDLIEQSNFSIHDLSRIELSRGIPRFNMPVELGLALYGSRVTSGRHRVYIFESKRYRAQRSTSDINGIDPQIHAGSPKGLMAGLRNIFRQPGDVTTVPEMLESYRAVRRKLPELKRNAGGQSLFEASLFRHYGRGTGGIAETNRAPSRQEVPLQSARAALRKLRE
jgi:hypothetical protein